MTSKRSFALHLVCAVVFTICPSASLQAQQISDTLAAIFNKHEFDAKRIGLARWLNQGSALYHGRAFHHGRQG